MHSLETIQQQNAQAEAQAPKFTTVVVSIGRNIELRSYDAPMEEKPWEDFRHEIYTLIEIATTHATGARILYTANGKGEYAGAEEETFVVGAIIPTSTVLILQRHLQDVAYKYAQEAVGFIATTNETLLYSAERSTNK